MLRAKRATFISSGASGGEAAAKRSEFKFFFCYIRRILVNFVFGPCRAKKWQKSRKIEGCQCSYTRVKIDKIEVSSMLWENLAKYKSSCSRWWKEPICMKIEG